MTFRPIANSVISSKVIWIFCVYMQDALNYSNFFLDAQKVGTLPVDNPVTWRSDAMTYELGPLDRDITGGYLQGGPAGNLKMTHPTAFGIALLAWGLLEFPTVSLPCPPSCLLQGFIVVACDDRIPSLPLLAVRLAVRRTMHVQSALSQDMKQRYFIRSGGCSSRSKDI